MNFLMNALIFKNQFENAVLNKAFWGATANPFKDDTVELDTGELSCSSEGWRQLLLRFSTSYK